MTDADLQGWESWLKGAEWPYAVIIFLIIASVFSYFLRKVTKKQKLHLVGAPLETREEIVAKDKLIRESEPEAPNVDWVIVLVVSQGQGFTDSKMIELISYLGSQGLPATYNTTSVGVEAGAMNTFSVKVARDDVAKSEELIRSFLKNN